MNPQSKKKIPRKNHRIHSLKLEKQDKKYRYADLIGLVIIILLGLIIYSNSYNCSFHFDDDIRICNNASIRNLGDVKAWWNSYPSRPISMLTFAINYHFDHLNVQYYHIVNIIIHLINTILVWTLTMLIFSSTTLKDNPINKKKNVVAFITALLFVSHPLATQSVTYIVQRMCSMVAMFFLLSLILYIKARLTTKIRIFKYLLFTGSLISAGLAMLTKENGFTLPFIIVLVEICFLRTKTVSINLKDYRVILTIIGLLSAFIIIPLEFPISIFKPIPPTSWGNTFTLTPLNYFFTQFSVIVKYIQLLLLPINQNVDYSFPISNSFFEFKTMLCFVVLLSLLFFAIFMFNRNRIISFGIFWFFLTLSVESSIIPISDVIFEHRTYLPSFGFFLILGSYLGNLLFSKYKYIAISIIILIIGSNSILTYARNKIWKNEITLWTDVISKTPTKVRPVYNLAGAYGTLGQWDKAILLYTKAIQIDTKFKDGYLHRGDANRNLGQLTKAIDDYTRAIEIDSNFKQAYTNRGITFGQVNQFEKAIADYSEAIRIDPKYAIAYSNRGIAYYNLGQLEKALADYSNAIAIDPKYEQAYYNRGNVNMRLKQWDRALSDYSSAIGIKPDYIDAYVNRGVAYRNVGKFDNSINDYTSALEINPNSADAYSNRGNVYCNLKKWDKAIDDYTRAIEIDQKNVMAYFNRGGVYSFLGQWDKAIDDYSKVIEINPNFKDAYSNRDFVLKKSNKNKK